MKSIFSFMIVLLFISCGKKEAEPIRLNVDSCGFCKMKIADGQFGAELITAKGRVYKFDDLQCMIYFHKENNSEQVQGFYIHDFNQLNTLIHAEKAFFVKGGKINSPMRGNIIALKTLKEAEIKAKEFGATMVSWKEIVK